MPPKPILDLSRLDLEATAFDREAIRRRNPQRFEMEMLDRIILFDPEQGLTAGVKRVRDDEFWIRGHFPGRPIFPGVLLIEAAAQLSSFYFCEVQNPDGLVGFASADDIRFRGKVVPGDLLVITGRVLDLKTRVARLQSQIFVGQNLVFEGTIVGMVF